MRVIRGRQRTGTNEKELHEAKGLRAIRWIDRLDLRRVPVAVATKVARKLERRDVALRVVAARHRREIAHLPPTGSVCVKGAVKGAESVPGAVDLDREVEIGRMERMSKLLLGEERGIENLHRGAAIRVPKPIF